MEGAVALFEAGRHEEAKASLRRHLERAPGDVGALKMLAMIHGALHEDEASLEAITRAAKLSPKDPEAQFMMGNVATILRRYGVAAGAYEATVKLQPTNLPAYDGWGKCLMSLGESARALEVYERAIGLAPGNADTYHRLGTTLALVGRVKDALLAVERGLRAAPGDPGLLEFLVYYRNFVDGVDPVAHARDHAALARTVTARVGAPATRFLNSRRTDRALRVAFLSSDYYYHACAFFLEEPLRALDRTRVEPYLYASPVKRDEFTERFRTLGVWRECAGLNPAQLAEMARADEIDIVVDCGGWTERSQMEACAARLAPVQVTYLGYPNTTGLPTMDYRVIDGWTDPPGSEDQCTERLLRLPGCFLCFRPPGGVPEFDPTPPSAVAGGAPITFGSFNRTMKVGDEAVATWAEVLRAVPGSRLLIKIQIASESVAPEFITKFEALGIARERILTADWAPKPGAHYPMYRRMDIALDSFPYNGTTTTCEALLMGVPVVVALAGGSHRSRVGVSLLNSVGVPELIAATPQEYVKVAAGLANDPVRLAGYHASLRGKLLASPLGDPVRFARQFEDALHGAWAAWCRGAE